MARDRLVWDCFIFNDELDLLELRLHELADAVDRFVIVEGDHTYQGRPRSPVFPSHADRFARWSDKIVHLTARLAEGASWDREHEQRRAILGGLDDAGPDDLVLISDVDEIPRPAVVERLAKDLTEPHSLGMEFFYYRFNLRVPELWIRAKAGRAHDVTDPQTLRMDDRLPVIPDAGWHFSYLGDTETILAKLDAFAHTEISDGGFGTPRHVERSIELGVDFIRGRVLERVGLDTMPDLVRAGWHPEWVAPPPAMVRRAAARSYALATIRRPAIGPERMDQHPGLACLRAEAWRARTAISHRLKRFLRRAPKSLP